MLSEPYHMVVTGHMTVELYSCISQGEDSPHTPGETYFTVSGASPLRLV